MIPNQIQLYLNKRKVIVLAMGLKDSRYFKVMMSVRVSSYEKGFDCSTASGGNSTAQPIDKILRQIKEKAFDVDLIEVLENNNHAFYNITNFLKQMDILKVYLEAVHNIFELRFFLGQVSANLLRKQEVSTKFGTKLETQVKSVMRPMNLPTRLNSWRSLFAEQKGIQRLCCQHIRPGRTNQNDAS
ncbi:unnamed protein product [Vicia faba]|uniref:Uncharacterized protein n=1 Tax=Vicia faba TaxID=3906 RepID=A0AAV0ZP30_VICFA|nr:unnamed protein product [Vicia faba]